jgi:3-dehydroquinate dehydratase II
VGVGTGHREGCGVRVLLINGPNLNLLGRRDLDLYGAVTLREIEDAVRDRGVVLGAEVECFQSNSEGALIDFIQERIEGASGIVINAGALAHYGLSLRDALADSRLPVVEVHISNVHARERWRTRSVVAPVAVGQIVGLGWKGYLHALELLVDRVKEAAE